MERNIRNKEALNQESEKGNAKKESSKKEINESGEHGGMRCQFPGSLCPLRVLHDGQELALSWDASLRAPTRRGGPPSSLWLQEEGGLDSGNQGEIKPLFQQQFNVASSQLHNLRAKSEKIKEVNCVLKGKQSVNYDTAYSQDVANFVRVSVSVDHNNDMETDQINFDKSGIFFSSNVLDGRRDVVRNLLGVENCSCPEKYLGLPATVGRNKSQALSVLIFGTFATKRLRFKNAPSLLSLDKEIVRLILWRRVLSPPMAIFFWVEEVPAIVETIVAEDWRWCDPPTLFLLFPDWGVCSI
ncbi:hypothetical protein V6N13_014237 [Hibiscus sabdariffa]